MTACVTRHMIAAVAGAVLSAVPAALPLSAQALSWSGSLAYTRGDYIFTQRTDSWSLLNTVTLRQGTVRVGVGVPLILQNSAALAWVNGSYMPTGGPDHGTVGQRSSGERVPMGGRRGMGPGGGGPGGALLAAAVPSTDSTAVVAGPGSYRLSVGDPLVGSSIEVYRGFDTVRSLGIELFVKPPIATIKSGVGTGAWDVGAGGSAALSVGRAYLFGDVSYWHLGDMPDLELRGNVGYGLAVGIPSRDGAWSALASLAGSTAVVANTEPPATVGLAVSHSPRIGRSLSVGVYAGLTESASALSINVGWTVTGSQPSL